MKLAYLTIFFFAVCANSACAPDDDPNECKSLIEFAKNLKYKKWKDNKHWMSSDSICKWKGITCTNGHVTDIKLKKNGLSGILPASIGNLNQLTSFNVNGGRPDGYFGCGNNNFKNSTIPEEFYNLTALTSINMEYTCISGPLSPRIGQLINLEDLSLHGNFLSGTIPNELNKLTKLKVFKLGRNPFVGGFPNMTNLHKLVQFNCNFCALTGPVLDIFDNFPDLELTYWDGNGFSGPLPASIGRLKKIQRLSFNINNMSGPMPDWSKLSTLTDCRVGYDTNLTAYLANYPWIPKVSGNVYTCPLPAYATGKGICNHTTNCEDVINPCSPIKCK